MFAVTNTNFADSTSNSVNASVEVIQLRDLTQQETQAIGGGDVFISGK
jgi:hypothetical protein